MDMSTDYTQLTDQQLITLLNETSTTARTAYKIRKELETEQHRRFTPTNATISYIYDNQPTGLTSKQISQIRKWAKQKHNTEDLIKFITNLIESKPT